MKISSILLIFLFFTHYGCTGQKEKQKQELKTKVVMEEKPIIEKETKNFIKSLHELSVLKEGKINYTQTKQKIGKLKVQLRNKQVSKDSLAIIFKESLVNEIIPFWEGTTWSFEGHTSVPRRGEIACGYFVSTTLKDVGVNLNRYKLAQQSPINEANSLALGTKVFEVEEGSIKGNIKKINEILPNGIHFIGFDYSHVGYVFKDDNELYLIHSNYIGNECVEIEKIEKSEVFSSFNKLYIVPISTNEVFLNNWIKGEEIKIVTSF